MPNERGPVGGAGELTALAKEWRERSINAALPWQERDSLRVCATELETLAAKAPQGVPGHASWIAGHCSDPQNCATCLRGWIREALDSNCDWEEREGRIRAALAAPPAPSLPVPGPVSDTTIHHGMFPPAPSGATTTECICNSGFGMNLSCPVHKPREAAIARPFYRELREALAAAPSAPTNDHELLVGGVVRAALELAILRGDLRMDNGDSWEEMSESEREDVISDTWNAMNGEGTCEGGQVKELKAIYAALAGGRHASAERVRELPAKWRDIADDFDITRGDSEVEAAYYQCADELERALPPSTGEKS